jgi:acetyl esterase/lipase
MKKLGSKDSIANPKQLGELIDSCFTESYSNKPGSLRQFSPNWLQVNTLKKINFPKTTLIVGENDFYRMDSEIFYAKLIQAKKTAQLVLLAKADHSIMWHALYPIYISKPLLLLKTSLRMIVADKNLTDSDERLKTSYQALISLRKQHDKKRKKNPNITKPIEATHWEDIHQHLSELEKQVSCAFESLVPKTP